MQINIPIFVSDMSFGALSKEAKIALSKGAEMAGTGICSGEGGQGAKTGTGGHLPGKKVTKEIAASHIEADIDFALKVGVDYIILDGRGGGTGSAPTILRVNINVPTIPALARARRHLDKVGAKDVTLIITGGLRLAEDFAKAMMLGADAIAVANSALQAIRNLRRLKSYCPFRSAIGESRMTRSGSFTTT